MSKADLIVERGAEGLHQLAVKAAARGDGVGEWLADELEADSAFLRKLKPSLIAARARANGNGGAPSPTPPPAQPEPQTPPAAEAAAPPPPPAAPNPRPKRRKPSSGSRKRWALVGAALVAGIVAAKLIDWRGNGDPGD
jgi:cell division septation protein DedD